MVSLVNLVNLSCEHHAKPPIGVISRRIFPECHSTNECGLICRLRDQPPTRVISFISCICSSDLGYDVHGARGSAIIGSHCVKQVCELFVQVEAG